MSATTKKKHVERELAEDYCLPKDQESIVQLIKPRGNNLHQVKTADGEEFLVSMPHKFRKHVWIKRGDFVVIEPIPEGNKVKAEIVRILMHDHILHLKENKLWPKEFEYEKEVADPEQKNEGHTQENEDESGESSDDEHLFENPNRKRVVYEETESESEESDGTSDTED
ncbi:putative RNA-binding protein EIF1AD isoform X2 [Oratosquilla oratoria]